MQDTTSGDCKALPPGQSNLITLPCDSAVAAQRWRPAAYQGELAAGAVLQDSRLESASNPGTCVMLQNTTTGGLQPVVASCFAADLLSASANVPSEVCSCIVPPISILQRCSKCLIDVPLQRRLCSGLKTGKTT